MCDSCIGFSSMETNSKLWAKELPKEYQQTVASIPLLEADQILPLMHIRSSRWMILVRE
jgi:hypothetical protein